MRQWECGRCWECCSGEAEKCLWNADIKNADKAGYRRAIAEVLSEWDKSREAFQPDMAWKLAVEELRRRHHREGER